MSSNALFNRISFKTHSKWNLSLANYSSKKDIHTHTHLGRNPVWRWESKSGRKHPGPGLCPEDAQGTAFPPRSAWDGSRTIARCCRHCRPPPPTRRKQLQPQGPQQVRSGRRHRRADSPHTSRSARATHTPGRAEEGAAWRPAGGHPSAEAPEPQSPGPLRGVERLQPPPPAAAAHYRSASRAPCRSWARRAKLVCGARGPGEMRLPAEGAAAARPH